jgi:hypothetical protein
MSPRWKVRASAWAKLTVVAVLISSFAVMAGTGASANSALTLYVASTNQGTASCLDVADACDQLQTAINLADGFTNTDVTINVSAGTFYEHDTILLPTSDTLKIEGTSSSSTIVDGQSTATDFSIGTHASTGPVTLVDLAIDNGLASGQAMSGNPDGNASGGGIDNQDGDLTLTNDVLTNDDVYGGSTGSSPGGYAYGGALYDAGGHVQLTNDTFSNDQVFAGSGGPGFNGGSAAGGAVFIAGGTLNGQLDTFGGDTATGGEGGSLFNGFSGGDAFGGAVQSDAGTLSFVQTTFSNDDATGGAGGSTAEPNGDGGAGNNAYGGALDNDNVNADTILNQDTFSGDEASGGPGGTGGAGGMNGQSGSAFGGGFYNDGNLATTATLTDDTFTQDSATSADADAYGGAVDNESSTTSVLFNTLADNTVSSSASRAGAALYNANGSVTIANSILQQSGSCSGTFIDGGYNVESDISCVFALSEEGYTFGAIGLASLASGGSGPETMAIDNTSKAFEEVPTTSCTSSFDERGQSRPGVAGAYCDAGAYEWQGYTVTYNANGGSGGPTDSNTYAPNENVNVLFSSPPTNSGYGFGGWCTVQEPVDTACPSQPQVFPHPDFPVTGLTMGSADVTLYALWDTPTTLYVNENENGTTCANDTTNACPTIQDAINQAQTLFNSAVTIDVAPGTYDENDQVDLTNNDTINVVGAGVNTTAISGVVNQSDFTVDLGLVTIDELSIENGGGGSNGGGGIRNYGAVTATNDTFSGNSGQDGGAIEDDGSLIATNDTFTNNEAGDYGAAIDVPEDGYLVATNDTFTNNDAGISGGGIYSDSEATLAQEGPNSSFFTFYASAAILTNDTFYADSASTGDALANQGSPVTFSNSILDEIDSCTGNFPYSPDGGYNVESDNSCNFTSSTVGNSSINLASTLAANGSTGPETLTIDPTSSAYQEVPIANCTLTTDERGDPRPGSGADCDAGAFEYEAPQNSSPPPPSPTTTTTMVPTTTTTLSLTTPPVSRFVISYVAGTITGGARSTLTIGGAGFYAQPTVSMGVAGLKFVVVKDTRTLLITYVTAPPGFKLKQGIYTLTVKLANGKKATKRQYFA